MDKERMRQELRSEARALLQMYGPITGRHFTVNIDAGTISDIRDGSVYVYVSWPWLMSPQEELTARTYWIQPEDDGFMN